MDEEQLKKHAEFEDKFGASVITPNLMQKLAGMDGTETIEDVVGKSKVKQQFFYVVLQDNTGKIIDINHYTDYDTALMRGMEKAKETGSSWSIFSLQGKFIDGNFTSR
jgi:hypothetical protein